MAGQPPLIPIPGSKLYRVYCDDCGEPMRDVAERVGYPHFCEDCGGRSIPAPWTNLTPRQAAKLTQMLNG